MLDTARARLKGVIENLEFKIDQFANGVHKLNMLDEAVDQTVDKVTEEASNELRLRDEGRRSGAGSEKASIRDVLRALSRA